MPEQHQDIEEITNTIIAITKLLKKKKIENPSDERLIIQAIRDYEKRGEWLSGTHKWINSVIDRNGKKFTHRND